MTRRMTAGAILAAAFLAVAPAEGQENAFMGEVRFFAGDFCPYYWLPADGRTMKIKGHTALFALLGTMYGGDGKTTFALPDLRGRKIAGAEQTIPGQTAPGKTGGAEYASLDPTESAPHAHGYSAKAVGQVEGSPAGADTADPSGALLSIPDAVTAYGHEDKNLVSMAHATVALVYDGPTNNAGKGTKFPVLDPSLALIACINVLGDFPVKN